ncbi:histone-like nucleoid-structuring protein Lsr2 [Rhodococcoides corynebacterioides]|uniref:Lsr2 family protein n=1 Tax=Rhodococcoides corynebacterioides TaxID=53972 RepID=A0ABS7P2V3_9NOCA|nr:Lsr2 family protein [Rhodococcus corynebacterioides]MBY6366749.1 Lsr2 family protein [Rhodococcus corynebacterioides]MBY6409300.1 Lsr2 family protein [Rhodococcus corynebacterioides]
MAKKVVIELVDDIDRSPLGEDGEHIVFSIDGVDYEIDLGPDNAAEFRRTLGRYVEHATRVRSAGTSAARSTGRAKTGRRSPESARAVREWAAGAGYTLAPRGRIPAEVQQAYEAAHA